MISEADLSSLTHSASDSRIRGPSHALTLAAWNLTHLRAVVFCSHWSVNSPYVWNFVSAAEESNPKLLPSNAFPGLTIPQNALTAGLCCPGPRWRSFQYSTTFSSWIWRGRFATENGKGKGCERIRDTERKEREGKVREGMEGMGRSERRVKKESHFTVMSAWDLRALVKSIISDYWLTKSYDDSTINIVVGIIIIIIFIIIGTGKRSQ